MIVAEQEVTPMRPYSTDLGERVAAAIDHHEGSFRQIARTFRVSLSFIVRLLQRRHAAGTLEPKPHGSCPPKALGPDDRQRTRTADPPAARRHLGATSAARRLPLQLDDALARPAASALDVQEEAP